MKVSGLCNLHMQKPPIDKSERMKNMEYNSEKEIWRSKEDLYTNPPFIPDFEKYLSKGISERVKYIKEDCGLSVKKMYEHKPFRINQIMECEYPTAIQRKKDGSSFITDAILFSITEAANRVVERKGNHLPEIINRFWIIFGNEQDLREFIKGIYYNFCLWVLSNKQTQNSEQINIIQDLFYADAGFSFIYGQAKINNLDINAEHNVKERRALYDAVKYTWDIISDEVIAEFKNSFDHDNQCSNYYIGNSHMINKQISTWCDDILMTYLKRKREELKNDSIANIGYCVHNLMEMLFEKRNIDKKFVPSQCDNNFEATLVKSDKRLLGCAENLVKSQKAYFDNIRNRELEISIAENIEKSKNYELEGDFCQIGTDYIISFDDSGKTFEELINEAIKTCRNK